MRRKNENFTCSCSLCNSNDIQMIAPHCMYCGSRNISELPKEEITEEYLYTHHCENCDLDLVEEDLIEE